MAAAQLLLARTFGEFRVDEGSTTASGGDPEQDDTPITIPLGYCVRQLDERTRYGIAQTSDSSAARATCST